MMVSNVVCGVLVLMFVLSSCGVDKDYKIKGYEDPVLEEVKDVAAGKIHVDVFVGRHSTYEYRYIDNMRTQRSFLNELFSKKLPEYTVTYSDTVYDSARSGADLVVLMDASRSGDFGKDPFDDSAQSKNEARETKEMLRNSKVIVLGSHAFRMSRKLGMQFSNSVELFKADSYAVRGVESESLGIDQCFSYECSRFNDMSLMYFCVEPGEQMESRFEKLSVIEGQAKCVVAGRVANHIYSCQPIYLDTWSDSERDHFCSMLKGLYRQPRQAVSLDDFIVTSPGVYEIKLDKLSLDTGVSRLSFYTQVDGETDFEASFFHGENKNVSLSWFTVGPVIRHDFTRLKSKPDEGSTHMRFHLGPNRFLKQFGNYNVLECSNLDVENGVSGTLHINFKQ